MPSASDRSLSQRSISRQILEAAPGATFMRTLIGIEDAAHWSTPAMSMGWRTWLATAGSARGASPTSRIASIAAAGTTTRGECPAYGGWNEVQPSPPAHRALVPARRKSRHDACPARPDGRRR